MAARQPELAGKRVREYEILKLIGRGGMGAVYLARHVLLQEERAIKVVRSQLAGDQSFVERFVREARVLSRLKNDHLVRLYEFWEEGGTLFMALEFLHGESLKQRLDVRGRLGPAEAVRIARQAAVGLEAAHAGGVVHRDVSPDNIQLVRSDEGLEIVKVMDFGIAKSVKEAAGLTANLFLGKLEYASPEQCGFGLARGETVDSRSDIYSLAVTLYHTLAGRLPFDSETPQGFLLKHATEVPAALSSVVPDTLPPELDRLVAKALSKHRSERQQSMRELIAELDALPLLAGRDEGVPTLPARTPTRVPEPQPERETMSLARPTLGSVYARRFLVESLVGEGGMGIVYRARDNVLGETVALKMISRTVLHEAGAIERLKREVVLARRISHPNVCRLHDIGEGEGEQFVSMQYVDGKPLERVIRERGRLSLAEGVPLVRQVLDGLAAAHHVGVVHRDLKPDNILISHEGHAVITDFGLSLAEGAARVTHAGLIVGTPSYMAPEQASGAKVDGRTDLYAVGVMLFRMFTGQFPFEGETPLDVLSRHATEEPPRPSSIAPGIDPRLEAIILKAMQKNPQRRFQSAEEFLDAMEALPPTRVRRSSESGRVTRAPGAPPSEPPSSTLPLPASGEDSDSGVVKQWMQAQATVQGSPTVEKRRGTRTAAPRSPGTLAPPRKTRAEARSFPIGPFAVATAAVLGLTMAAMRWWWPEPVAPPVASSVPTAVSVAPPAQVKLPPVSAPAPPTTLAPRPTEVAPSSPPATPRTIPAARPAKPDAGVTADLPKPPPVAPPTPIALPSASPPPATLPEPVPTALVPSPPTAPSVKPPPSAPTPEQGVRRALERYQDAFNRRDEAGVRAVFPSIPDRNLQGLQDFSSYRMDVTVEKLEVQDKRVLVEARIRNTWVTFSGKQDSRSIDEKMVFLQGADGAWVRIK